jgi:glycosyltransferase involved in cell wall biosynthesis
MSPLISVIICTHNPRRNYLQKVIDALSSQSLPFEQWEILLVDNASDQILAAEFDLSWHPQARHIREEQLGLTPARLRGIKEAATEVLVFVDDDNVLDDDYLEIAWRISKDFPLIGAWGGQIIGEFEMPPPEWAKPYLGFLAIREFTQDKWSNLLHQHETTPCGAGLCIRKVIAEHYAELVEKDLKRLGLDRKGKLLTSCGDSDLAFTACDMGFGTGQFIALKLTHLLPKSRLDEAYLLRLVEGMYYSHTILDAFRGKFPDQSPNSLRTRLREAYCLFTMNAIDRRFYNAQKRGLALAIQEIKQF